MLQGLFGVLLGALGGHKISAKSNDPTQHPALGPQDGPGRLPGTIFGGFWMLVGVF